MFIDTKKQSYTVESVTSGHPDKVCDQISDAILDACLTQDHFSRVAIECLGSHGLLVIGGEITTKASVNYKEVARDVYKNIGYEDELEIITKISEQSPDIALGVDKAGAGDQGIMYGYATDETPEFLPKGLVIVHRLSRRLEEVRRNKTIPWLLPDGKTQVTVENGLISKVLVSAQHEKTISPTTLREEMIEKVIAPIIESDGIQILTNPTGSFTEGGFQADAGETGRKIMIDTYGGLAPHGGGCFSGKDATKVDRSAAYMARFVAKNLVANNYGKNVQVAVAYAIGVAEPLMIEAWNEEGKSLKEVVKKNFDFRPHEIIKRLDLNNPIYQKIAAYGHFGNTEFSWEKIIEI